MNIKDLDLNLLIVFHTIYEARSLSAAATQLDLSQPGMSHALKRLRTQLGDKLFVRKGNGVEPTAYAETISEPIRLAISFLEQSLAPPDRFDPKTSSRPFRLMLADFVEPLIMPALIDATIENSGVTFELISSQSMTIEDAVLDGSADLVVHLQADMMHEISAEPLFPVEPILLYRKGHPITQEANVWASYMNYRQIVINLKPNAVKNFDKAKITQSISRQYMTLVNSIRSIPHLVAQSDCVSLVPKLYALHAAPRYGLSYAVPPRTIMSQDITMSWHRKNDVDTSIAWLKEVIRGAIADHQDEAKALLG